MMKIKILKVFRASLSFILATAFLSIGVVDFAEAWDSGTDGELTAEYRIGIGTDDPNLNAMLHLQKTDVSEAIFMIMENVGYTWKLGVPDDAQYFQIWSSGKHATPHIKLSLTTELDDSPTPVSEDVNKIQFNTDHAFSLTPTEDDDTTIMFKNEGANVPTWLMVEPSGDPSGIYNTHAAFALYAKDSMDTGTANLEYFQWAFRHRAGEDPTYIIESRARGTGTVYPINFRVGDNWPLTLDENGNVGIGTIDPQAQLDVQGDVEIGGNLGIGIEPTTDRLKVQSTDVSAVRTTTEKTIDQDVIGYKISLTDTYTGPANNSYETNKRGWGVLSVTGSHQGSGTYSANFTGGWYQLILEGSAAYLPGVRAQINDLAMKTSGTYTIYNWIANEGGFTDFSSSTGTYNITNMATYQSSGLTIAGSGTYNVTNMFHYIANDWNSAGTINGTQTNVGGMKIEKQTAGNNPMGIWLAGNGAGSDIVFGPNQEASIYSSGGELFAKDGASNVTQISPHDPETGEWIFYSKNVKTGRTLRVNMEELVKDMEKLTGKKYLIESFVESK